jgi:hypothetical protein
MFMWLLTQRRIQCRTVLHRKNVLPNTICEVCNELDETPEHIMGGCAVSKQLWQRLGLTAMTTAAMTDIHQLTPLAGSRSAQHRVLGVCCSSLLAAMENEERGSLQNRDTNTRSGFTGMQGNSRAMALQVSDKETAHCRSVVSHIRDGWTLIHQTHVKICFFIITNWVMLCKQ